MTHEDLRSVTRLHFLTCSFEMQFIMNYLLLKRRKWLLILLVIRVAWLRHSISRLTTPRFNACQIVSTTNATFALFESKYQEDGEDGATKAFIIYAFRQIVVRPRTRGTDHSGRSRCFPSSNVSRPPEGLIQPLFSGYRQLSPGCRVDHLSPSSAKLWKHGSIVLVRMTVRISN